jgi:hypothetical protein
MIKTATQTVAPMLLALGITFIQATAVFAQPPLWETRTGATLPGQALDDVDNGTVSLTFGSMSFPFAGTTYTGNATLNISSNGFISLGGDNGDGCCDGDPTDLVQGDFVRIAPFWTDLNPDYNLGIGGGGDIYYETFNDDADPAIDRIVITFATGFHDCVGAQCSALVQLQLLGQGNKYARPAGTIIFGYNGIIQTASQSSNILVGLSPGNGAADPGNTDFSTSFETRLLPFSSGTTIYELFSATTSPASPPPFDLDDTNIVYTPNGTNSFDVSDTLPNAPPSSAPPFWESALGATIRGTGVGLDDEDDASIIRTLGMSFPFGVSEVYTNIAISSNGFISLGGDNGDGCFNQNCSGDPQQLLGFLNPTIAPLWTDLEPGPGGGGDIYYNAFNDDTDPAIDRVVITFATGFHDCVDAQCSALAQLQLLGQGNTYAKPAGTIIFGYNGIVQTNRQTSNILVGVSPGNNAADPGSTNLNAKSSFNTGVESTVYQLFVATSPPPIDLDGGNVVFEPNGKGGYVVSTPGFGASSAGNGGGGGGCALLRPGNNPPDPLFPSLLSALALVHGLRRRYQARHQRVCG